MESLRILLAEHYGQKAERLRRAAQGYVDDKLREIFPPPAPGCCSPPRSCCAGAATSCCSGPAAGPGWRNSEAQAILEKLEERAAALKLSYPRSRGAGRSLDVVALVVALSIQYATTGRFSG